MMPSPLKNYITVAVLLLCFLHARSQEGPPGIEFIENKGQWDSPVRYLGELSSGNFYLQKNGFRVLLHDTADLRKLVHVDMQLAASATAARRLPDHPDYNIGENGGKAPGSSGSSDDRFILHSHVYNVSFVGADTTGAIIPDKPVPSYNNYFIGNDRSRWASHVNIYQAVVYKNVYPNIDVRYYSENGYLKYDIIVNPGGDISQVVMRYEGADKLSVNKYGQLIVNTSVGEVKELAPYSFQFDKTTGRQEVECKYKVSGNEVRFSVKNYSSSATLVIDPTLVFCTFTGSPANNWGFTATPGPDGSLFAGGTAHSSGYPVTTGAVQANFAGGNGTQKNPPRDVAITRFSPRGNARMYSTYLGGTNNEYPHSLYSDPQGNLVIMGRTYSTGSSTQRDNFPGTKVGTGGSADIFVTKLNASGTSIIGSLVIGGSGKDGVNIDDQQESQDDKAVSVLQNYGDDSRSEVILDNAGNIYVAAQSQSTNFPTTAGVVQPNLSGGQDGVVMKIKPDCSGLLWATYLGGSNDDGAFVLALNPTDNSVYVAGATLSTNFPGNSGGTISASAKGDIDGFVTILNNNGTAQLKTTYIGTAAADLIYGIQFDKKGFPYIMGTTRGTWSPINATYVQAGSQFIGKLQPDLSAYVYTTTFGNGAKQPNISPVAFLVDRCENVYISGWGGWPYVTPPDLYNMSSTLQGMPITSDAIQKTTDNHDFYFIVIQKNASALLYGTYFGQSGGFGEHVDGGTSRYDQQGVIYQAVCANCGSGRNSGNFIRFPTTSGVIGPYNLAGDCNLAAIKIAFEFAGVASGPRPYFNGVPDSTGCVPFTVVFRDTILNAVSYIWNFGDGSPDVETTNTEVTHTFNNIGYFRVRLIAIDSNSCNISDTAYVNIRVRDDPAFLDFSQQKIGPCESLTYEFINQSIPAAGKPFKANSFIWDFDDGTRIVAGTGTVQHSFNAPGTYHVRLVLLDTNYCNAPDSLVHELRVSPNVKALFATPSSGCAPYTAFFNNTSLGGQDFEWDFGDGSPISTDASPTHLYNNTGIYIIKLIANDASTCNKTDTVTRTISVYPKPVAQFNAAPMPPEVNTPTTFYNNSTGGVRYLWIFGDGSSVIKQNMDTVQHQYNSTDIYQACLVTYNQFECTDTVCHEVEALIDPLLDVPNAFTPGRFGRNSIIRVEGFGIERMTWKIYNRWGQLVFESHNRWYGWDGTYKGKPQAMDVYTYTLEAEFVDGRKTTRKGDITLIR